MAGISSDGSSSSAAPPGDTHAPGPAPARRVGAGTIWLTAALTGVVTATVSTLFIVFGSGRIGRDLPLSWMEVGMIALRDSGITIDPGPREQIAGLAVHMGADFGWALLFWAALARWTWRLRPWQLLVLAPVWAVLTSVAEYYLILPWLQPKLRMQSPYWINLFVHLGSASAYPLFYLWRRLVSGRDPGFAGFGRAWAGVLGGILGIFALGGVLGATGHDPAWPFNTAASQASDRSFLRSMAHHHAIGVDLARLAAERAEQSDLRVLGRLMVAEQQAETEQMRNLWHNWYGGALSPPTPEEHARMPGMPAPGAVEELRQLQGPAFDNRFLALMLPHHRGAIEMANEAMNHTRDPRLFLFADNVRHPQGRQVDSMERIRQNMETSR